MKRSRGVTQNHVSSNSDQQQRPKRMRSNNSKDEVMRLNPPSQVAGLAETSGDNGDVCTFCFLPGSFRECEGKLLGPFKSPYNRGKGANVIFAHRNCALWSPHTYESKSGRLERVDVARKLMRKCIFCRGKGASLHCTHKGKKCCRAMHFRCALRGGATLLDGFEAFCPKHANFSMTEETTIRLLELGPISDILLKPGNGCTYCDEDSYNRYYGVILTCTTCNSRAHSKCIFPKDRDAIFLTASSRSKHFCENCMVCVRCERPVTNREYKQRRRQQQNANYDPQDADSDQDDCTVLICGACNYFACHSSCVPQSQHKYWRCNRCRACRHCSRADIPEEEWHEAKEACTKCYKEIQKGAVVCPVCDKLYREFEGLEMVQCDGCDRWIHAISCGGLSPTQFKRLESVKSVSYHCPLCVEARRGRGNEKLLLLGSSQTTRISSRTRQRRSAPSIAISDLPPLNEEVAFFHTRSGLSGEHSVPSKVMDDLAVGTEMCRLCCTSVSAESSATCIACGECYHYGCDSLVVIDGIRKSNDNEVNGLQHKYWICTSCRSTGASLPKAQVGLLDTHCGTLVPHAKSNVMLDNIDNVSWLDKRVCEFCGNPDGASGTEGIGGRLIPWRSSINADLSDIWVHVSCALVSSGMMLLLSNNGATFLSQRRTLLTLARKSRCVTCGKTGATVKCCQAGCTRVFHAVCAEKVGFTCVVSRKPVPNGKNGNSKDRKIQLYGGSGEVCCAVLSCRNHSKQAPPTLLLSNIIELLKLDGLKMVRIIDSHGFVLGAEAGRNRLISMGRQASLRVGSLSVLRFGTLVPESNNFIAEGCLVPLGYCAARRYWSSHLPGRRCVYLLEVNGHIQTGPLFCIRSTEDRHFFIEESDVNIAWKKMTNLITQAQPWIRDMTTAFEGLDAFGLKNCTAVVQHIESLPLAAMFRTRYLAKYGVETKCSDVVFYEALAKKYVPTVVKLNESGCARTEGYLPRRVLRMSTVDSPAPPYENARSGLAFQLEVAREVLCNQREAKIVEVITDDKGIDNRAEQAGNTVLGGRRRRSSGVVTGHESSLETRNGIPAVDKKTPRSKRTSKSAIDKDISNGPDDDSTRPRGGRSIAPDAKRRTRIIRSEIDGWGVFATEDIAAEQLIVEYVGELIRPALSDLREARYQNMGIGCYMFQIVPGLIVDATLCGNAARFINHSCAPNCYSKTLTLPDGREVVAIFSKRRIQRGEELSYDYQFPFDDDDRVVCGCGAVQCRGFMN